MKLKFALAGNPNSGKTTLFNRITGSNAHVGNFPGVTVERREGRYKRPGGDIDIIDLPGIYSTSPYSPEERVARAYIIDEQPDLIINVVDVTNIERSLYMTTELLETNRPLIVVLNMIDRAKRKGYKLDIHELESRLGVPVVPVSAFKGEGIEELMDAAVKTARIPRKACSILENTYVYPYFEKVAALLKKEGIKNGLYHAVKLIQHDEIAEKELEISQFASGEIERISKEAAALSAINDIEADIADFRFKYIVKNYSGCVKKGSQPNIVNRSDKIDRVLTSRFCGLPIFVLIMAAVFFLTFGELSIGCKAIPMPGTLLQGLAGRLVELLGECSRRALGAAGASKGGMAESLVADGIIGGVGSVLGFLPPILTLFTLMSILEGTGYMARAAFMMDKIFRKFGLSGKSFVPLLMGFGCSVPAVMASRTIENEKDRRLTILLIPFMSCGAKMPIHIMFAMLFFPENRWAVILAIYLSGIVLAIISGIVLKRTVFKGDTAPFIMELPEYRWPSARNVLTMLLERSKHFAVKAGSVILLATVIIWFLSSFSFNLRMVDSSSKESILGTIGSFIAPVFAPLGFGNWQTVVAILTGFLAKEAVVSTYGVLFPGTLDAGAAIGGASNPLFAAMQNPHTWGTAMLFGGAAKYVPAAAALSFMLFCLIAPPCAAAISAIGQEMKSAKWTAFCIAYQLVLAYAISFVVFQAGSLAAGVHSLGWLSVPL